jgi:hypothetical protein
MCKVVAKWPHVSVIDDAGRGGKEQEETKPYK